MSIISNKRFLDTSDELNVIPWKNGIKLERPTRSTSNLVLEHNHLIPIKELMNFPINVYFLNTMSQIQRINETTATVFNFLSCKDALNKTAEDVTIKETSFVILENDKRVIKQEQMLIDYERGDLKNGKFIEVISVKMPWYNDDDRIVGLLGMSFISLQFLRFIFRFKNFNPELNNLDLLTKERILKSEKILVSEQEIALLSKREIECLYYLGKGKTYKEIAIILKLSPRTIEHYIESIKDKWNCSLKSKLIEKAQAYFKLI